MRPESSEKEETISVVADGATSKDNTCSKSPDPSYQKELGDFFDDVGHNVSRWNLGGYDYDNPTRRSHVLCLWREK